MNIFFLYRTKLMISQSATPHMASGNLTAWESILSSAQWNGVIIQPIWWPQYSKMLFIPGNWSTWPSCPQHVSSPTCVEEWLPLPPVLQVDENIEDGE